MAVLFKRPAFQISLYQKVDISYSFVTFCVFLFILPSKFISSAPIITANDVLSLTESKCVVAISNNGMEQTTRYEDSEKLLSYADVSFKDEHEVFLGLIDLQNFAWPTTSNTKTLKNFDTSLAVVFPRLVIDRTCLQKPTYLKNLPKTFEYTGPVLADMFVEFINVHCHTFRRTDGYLTISGLHRQHILSNLFTVEQIPNSVTIADIFKNIDLDPEERVCAKVDQNGEQKCYYKSKIDSLKLMEEAPKCERLPVPSREDFIENYLTRSKPVIFTGAINHWPAISKWTQEFLRNQYGDKEVHIKLTQKGEYEGVEPAYIWETDDTFQIPHEVLRQLLYPDLVVVRPAALNMKFSDFLNLIQNISDGIFTNVSAYLEYTSISSYFPELEKDITEMPFFHDVLKLAHLNIWLSDGNTLGKTHFDPFDNFLCQISGSKEVIMFEPHNNNLYEAHIPEAILSYNTTLKQFHRAKLMDSTSMVMSPVDILSPHFERFPQFGSARPLSCIINEGDVLFMPAFWWHEVQSRPSTSEHRNLAVNFWYEPFFKKEFPCSDCSVDINPDYRNLL